MRFPQLAAIFALVIGANHATAQVININLTAPNGDNPGVSVDGTLGVATPLPAGGTVFNEVNGPPVFTDLLDSTGNATGIGVDTAQNGNSAFTFSQVDNVDIIQGYWAGNQGFGAGDTAAVSTITFTGFDPNSQWDLAFVAQGDTDGQGATVTIGGQTEVSLGSDADGNLTDADGNMLTDPFTEGINFVLFEGVFASPLGEITVDVGATEADPRFVVLNALQLVATGFVAPDTCDVNGNGVCNSTDFATIRDSLFQFGDGLTAARTDGDLDGDGDVDFFDYRLFKDDLDRVIGVDAANALVAGIPEPGTHLLVAIGSLLVAARKRAR